MAGRFARVVLLGAPGVGKGTYARMIAKELQHPLVVSGDLVRAAALTDKTLDTHVRRGSLVPDKTIVPMVKSRLDRDDASNGFVLDGFPRTLYQAEFLVAEMLPDLVLSLELPEDVLIDKILGRRMCSNDSCGRGYNIADITRHGLLLPPLLPANAPAKDANGEMDESILRCDDCGSTLTKRPDDTREIATHRMAVFHKQSEPVEQYLYTQADRHGYTFARMPITGTIGVFWPELQRRLYKN